MPRGLSNCWWSWIHPKRGNIFDCGRCINTHQDHILSCWREGKWMKKTKFTPKRKKIVEILSESRSWVVRLKLKTLFQEKKIENWKAIWILLLRIHWNVMLKREVQWLSEPSPKMKMLAVSPFFSKLGKNDKWRLQFLFDQFLSDFFNLGNIEFGWCQIIKLIFVYFLVDFHFWLVIKCYRRTLFHLSSSKWLVHSATSVIWIWKICNCTV